jgi:sporulation protein YlmC with PRC-barrel domain
MEIKMSYQTPDRSTAKDQDKGGTSPGPDTRRGPGPELMSAHSLTGDEVWNRKSEELGAIKEIMLDMRTGRVAYAVMSFGGFLGMGGKLFAVPWEALTLDTKNKRFVLDLDKSKLEGAPGFDKDKWPNMADPTWAKSIHSYYGTKPNAGNPLL